MFCFRSIRGINKRAGCKVGSFVFVLTHLNPLLNFLGFRGIPNEKCAYIPQAILLQHSFFGISTCTINTEPFHRLKKTKNKVTFSPFYHYSIDVTFHLLWHMQRATFKHTKNKNKNATIISSLFAYSFSELCTI